MHFQIDARIIKLRKSGSARLAFYEVCVVTIGIQLTCDHRHDYTCLVVHSIIVPLTKRPFIIAVTMCITYSP